MYVRYVREEGALWRVGGVFNEGEGVEDLYSRVLNAFGCFSLLAGFTGPGPVHIFLNAPKFVF